MKRGRRNSTKKDSKKLQKTLSNTRPLKPMLTQLSVLHSQKIINNNINNKINININNNINVNRVECSKLQKVSSASNDVDLIVDNVMGSSDDKDFILSQDFFCTPDYITPECQNLFSNLDGNKMSLLLQQEINACPPSPEKLKTTWRKIHKQDIVPVKSPDSLSDSQKTEELSKDSSYTDEIKTEKTSLSTTLGKGRSYVPPSAVALRCRVMPPPCIRNPYIDDASETDVDPFDSWRTKCPGFFSVSAGADSMSRYRADFQEIEQIGNGNFSRVFKVLKRIDGCMYAVKHSIRQLYQDTERRKALMEVQALAALGFHENLVAYHTSWFENEKLYIQMELCDYSLSIHNSCCLQNEEKVLEALYQIARALKFIHEKGIAHLDLKPDNIYVKSGIFKLGDFGCATLLDKSLPIEEGDARYMPQEILNEKYDHLDKVDIFSLGVSIYELLLGSSLPDTGHQLLKEGKLPLLPTNSLQLQNLLKAMVDPDPAQRPSAKQIIENPIFSKTIQAVKSK
ncbi:wee1-like protein kinase isoform X1 [Silene latifolia]|uniref:wee1-like protein kinase isoform X1 n=1 Tax=Silene latifolia TaxID=37657 RepID=UPI003D77163A